MTQESNNLLPVGFDDLIFDEAKKNHDTTNSILNHFMNLGYGLIKTPLVEFANLSNQKDAFTFVDSISGRELVLRNDITLQISRLCSSVLKGKKRPLRLCYVGDVLVTQSDDLYANRQSSQLGLEIVGFEKGGRDEVVEAVLGAISGVSGGKRVAIEFYVPQFAYILGKALKVDDLDLFVEALKGKNISLIRQNFAEFSDVLTEIALKNSDLEHLLNLILGIADLQEIKDKLQKMSEVEKFVTSNFKDVEVYFDLFGDESGSYHKDFAFDVFCEDFAYPIARGGSYEMDGVDSVGATIYMNYLGKSFMA